MNISVLGCGRWGSFIAWYLSNHGHNVYLWGEQGRKSFEFLKENRKNEYVDLNKNINLTSDLHASVEHAQLVIISISAQSLRQFIKDKLLTCCLKDKIICLCMKGLEENTGKRLSEIAVECGINTDNLAVWVGPGHIQSFVKGQPNCMVIDSTNKDLVKYMSDSLKSELIRFYYGDDLIGTEIGAASKNVIGIAAGMLDGVGCSTLKGPLMARGAREIARLIKAMGGNELSAYGLCHLGDYETTLFSQFSHNRKFGEDFVKGVQFDKLAEGVATTSALKLLGEKYNVDLPITNAVYSILKLNKKPTEVFLDLFSRTTKKEF